MLLMAKLTGFLWPFSPACNKSPERLLDLPGESSVVSPFDSLVAQEVHVASTRLFALGQRCHERWRHTPLGDTFNVLRVLLTKIAKSLSYLIRNCVIVLPSGVIKHGKLENPRSLNGGFKW